MKINVKILTLFLKYANISIGVYWYGGILKYFNCQKLKKVIKLANLSRINKKQKQKNPLSSPKLINFLKSKETEKFNVLETETFCFLSERFFVRGLNILKVKNNKNKNKKYDSRILSPSRHTRQNRSQQNHIDSLGRRRINSQSQARQSGLALLFKKASGRNSSLGSTNQLLSGWARKAFSKSKQLRKTNLCSISGSDGSENFSSGLNFLSFLICLIMVWAEKYFYFNSRLKFFIRQKIKIFFSADINNFQN